MIAMQLTCPDLSSRQAPGRSTAAIEQDVERFGMPAEKPATVNAQIQPLDPGVVSEANERVTPARSMSSSDFCGEPASKTFST